MGFNNSSLNKKRRIGVKGLVLAFEVLDTAGSDLLNIMAEAIKDMRRKARRNCIFAFCLSSEADPGHSLMEFYDYLFFFPHFYVD